MKGRNIPDAAFYALFYGSLAGIVAGILIFKAGQAGPDWLAAAGVTLAVMSIIPLAMSGIIAYIKDAGRQRTRIEKTAIALHCVAGVGSITAITLMTEGTHFDTGARLAQASLLLWMTTTILYLAGDKISRRNGNDKNAPVYHLRTNRTRSGSDNEPGTAETDRPGQHPEHPGHHCRAARDSGRRRPDRRGDRRA